MNLILNILIRLVLTFVKTRGRMEERCAGIPHAIPAKATGRKIRIIKKTEKFNLESLRKVRYYEQHDEVTSVEIDNYISNFSETLAYQYALYSRQVRNQIYHLRTRLTKQISSRIKRWNADIIHSIMLLFGLSNAHPSYIFSAILGTSSFRIHA